MVVRPSSSVVVRPSSSAAPRPSSSAAPKPSSAAPKPSSAPVGSNLQTYTGAIGGFSAPPVTATNGRYTTAGREFNFLGDALQGSCYAQLNTCQNAANQSGNQGDLTVDKCSNQVSLLCRVQRIGSGYQLTWSSCKLVFRLLSASNSARRFNAERRWVVSSWKLYTQSRKMRSSIYFYHLSLVVSPCRHVG